MVKLTDKQERFCREYLVDLNATQAAIRSGYSVKTAVVQASRLLTKVKVQERIKQLNNVLMAKVDVSAKEIVSEYRKLAFTNAGNIFNWETEIITTIDLDGNETRKEIARVVLKPFEDMTPEARL